MVNKCLFNALVKYSFDDGVTPVPDLATSWETSPDGKTWIFNLRTDVRWHDGVDFTAEDVKFTFDTILDPSIGSRWRSTWQVIESIDVVDPHTVRMNLSAPMGSMLPLLAYNTFIVPKHKLQGQDLKSPPDFIAHPIGTGPFKFKEHVSGSYYHVQAYEDYYEGRAILDGIAFKVIPDVNVQIAQMIAGELDLTWTIEPSVMPIVQGIPNLALTTVDVPQYFFIALNNENPLFADKRVRQALAHGLDRDLMIKEALAGSVTRADSVVHPVMQWCYTDDVHKYEYDPDRARALLTDAGWTPGADGILAKGGQKFSFTITQDRGNPTREQLVIVAQQYWKALGMDVRLEFTEWNALMLEYREGRYDAHLNWWITAPDPDFQSYFGSTGTSNRPRYKNPELDKILEAGRSATTPETRAPYYHEMQKILAEELPCIWLFYHKEIRAHNTRIQGLPNIGYRDALMYMHRVTKD